MRIYLKQKCQCEVLALINLSKEDIVDLFNKETNEFILASYTTKDLREMYYACFRCETKKKKADIVVMLRKKL